MFLCDNCHDPERHVAIFRSRGRCEGCQRTADCIDCHFQICEKLKSKPAKEEK